MQNNGFQYIWRNKILDNIGSIPFISLAISIKLSGYYLLCPTTDAMFR
jgi:hypothetical protein